MTETIGKPARILAVANASAEQPAVRTALALAEAQGAALEVFACVEPPRDLAILARLAGEDPDRLMAAAVDRTRSAVRDSLDRILPDRPVALQVTTGKPYLEIIRHVARTGCDFVVKTAEPLSGLDRVLFSSTDQHLLRKCPCPVWLTAPGAATRPKRVVAAVDLDLADAAEPGTLGALNRRVVEAACLIAGAPEAEVTVLHAWDAIGEGMIWAFSGDDRSRLSSERYVTEILEARRAAMDRLLADIRTGGASRPRLLPRLARGAPEVVIRQECRDLAADVVVLGTVARTGLGGVFIGNTAENIINGLDCPVLAVKPEGFVSPLLRD